MNYRVDVTGKDPDGKWIGDDNNPGTAEKPLRTLQEAVRRAKNGEEILVDIGKANEKGIVLGERS